MSNYVISISFCIYVVLINFGWYLYITYDIFIYVLILEAS